MRKCVLADRDGTLIVEKHYLSDPAEVELIPGVAESIGVLRTLGWEVICVSNQSGVGRGLFSAETVGQVNRRMQELLAQLGAQILDVYFCPDPPGTESTHRKPAPGMAIDAAKAHSFELANSVVIGDKLCDVELGQNIGATSVLVRTGYGSITEMDGVARPDFVIDSFADLPAIIEGLGRNDAGLGASR